MTFSTTALAQYDAPKLVAALERAQERIRQLEQENSALRQEIRWIDRLLAVPASIMSPSHKVTLRAAVKAYQQGTPDEHGLVQIESWKLCKTVGQSRQTFLDNLTYCAEKLGVLTKKRERLVDSDTNDFTTNLSIGVTPRLSHPQQYQVEQPRNHGGERQLCPHCHSDRLQRKVTMTCMNCGSVLDEKVSLVNQGSRLDESPASRGEQAANEPVGDEQFTTRLQTYVKLTSSLTSIRECQLDDSVETQNSQAGNGYVEEGQDQEPASDSNVNLTAIKTNVLERQVEDSDMPRQEPATPPEMAALSVPAEEQHQAHTMSQADALAQAAHLLVEIAGPEPLHIEMSPRGPKKYYPVNRAFTEQDARAHLGGWKTKGAYLRHPGGMTRALCYDADTLDDWEALLDAARRLSEAGYQVMVEDSPAGRGGHLWIIYTCLVNAATARRHAAHVAPMLQQIKECWPGPGGNRVRLPGGKYVKPGFAAWCKLHDAHGARIAEDGQSAAWVLLDYQTPAELVADDMNSPEVPQAPGSLACHAAPAASELESCATSAELAALPNNDVVEQRPGPETDQQAQTCGAPHATTDGNGTPSGGGQTPGVDQHWHEKYNRQLWFHFTAAQLAAWYNERYETDDIVEFENNGMANAEVIGRPERTASLGRTKDRKWYSDFGASARRTDGKPDGGDVLELRARVNAHESGTRKPETMRALARQLVREAREALESAARNGEPPPTWVQAFMSPAGWQRYHQLCEEVGYTDQAITASAEPAPHTGVGGSCQTSAQAVPSSRPSPETIEAFAAEIGATIGEPCEKCGCMLYYQSGPYQMCHWCLPRPAKYGLLSDEQRSQLRALFPHGPRMSM